MANNIPLHVALLGYGKMGQGIAELLLREGAEVYVVDPQCATFPPHIRKPGIHFSPQLDADVLDRVRVCIDFTIAEAVQDNLQKALEAGVPYVLGTTGWQDKKHEFQSLVQQQKGSFLTASNFSLPVQLFFQSLERIAPLFALFPEFDVAGFERHHREKADSPSGTALPIANILLKAFPQKKSLCVDRSETKIDSSTLHFPSLRAGYYPGTHEVIFDAPSETVRLEMVSRNRDGFITGAVWAAKWITGSLGGQETPQPGWYELTDVLRAFVEEKLQGGKP